MADEASDQTTKADKENLDLSSLSSFTLGPDWVSGKSPQTRLPKKSFEDRPKGPVRDRRSAGPRKRARPERGSRDRPAFKDRHQPEREFHSEPFQPIVVADFYPEEEPFKVLAQAIRTSCRTFELFEIARLILQKPDRWVCVVRDPSHKEGEPAKLWACVQDGLPFQNEEDALAHALHHYLDEFFNIETVEADAPAGNFQMVHKCGMTGELLAPPNYHRYKAICMEHHATRLSHVPYARFEQRIESSREEEDIQSWLDKMKTRTRYTSKENPEQSFESREDVRLYLVTQAKDKLVRPAYSARFSGKTLALLNPGNPIRRSVEYLLEGQNRFPLDTANHLRGRLRRMHFAVYKRGSKGVSFVCAIKRHFRKPDEVLADNLQKLIDFLEAHPNFPAKDLPKVYLKLEHHDAPSSETDSSDESEGGSVEDTEAVEKEETKQPSASVLSEEELQVIKNLKTDLHYLVSQGYVIEYSDGRLYVPPIREDEIRHLEKVKQAANSKEPDTPADPATAAVPQSEEAVAESVTAETNLPAEPANAVQTPAEPAEAAEPVAPAEPAEPAEPIESAETIEPAEPIKSAETTEPAEPIESVEPTEPTEPTEPPEPTEPAEPVEPTEPTEPTEPIEPAKPVEPEAIDPAVEEAEPTAAPEESEAEETGTALPEEQEEPDEEKPHSPPIKPEV